MGKIAKAVTELLQRGARGAEVVALIERMEAGSKADFHQEFTMFWSIYPNRVSKGAAERVFPRALKIAGSLEVLLDGVHRYAAKRDDRPWKNPSTWLNGKCWEDEELPVVMRNVSLGASFMSAAISAKESESAALGTTDLFGGTVRRISGR